MKYYRISWSSQTEESDLNTLSYVVVLHESKYNNDYLCLRSIQKVRYYADTKNRTYR